MLPCFTGLLSMVGKKLFNSIFHKGLMLMQLEGTWWLLLFIGQQGKIYLLLKMCSLTSIFFFWILMQHFSNNFFFLFRGGHLGTVVILMQHGADPTICDGDGLQCVHIAAQLGFAGIMAYFIAKGANMNCQDRGGMTPLMWSAYRSTRCASSRLLIHIFCSLPSVFNKDDTSNLRWII